MSQHEDTLQTLLRKLRAPRRQTRRSAAIELGWQGISSSQVLLGLEQAMEDADPMVRLYASGSHLRLTQDKGRAIRFLVQELGRNTDSVVLEYLLDSVSALKANGQPAIPECQRLLQHPDPAVRYRATLALGGIGPLAEPAVSALAARLSDENALVRVGAADALGSIGVGACHAVPRLAEVIGDPDRAVRVSACKSLGWIGKASAPALPALIQALRDDDAEVRFNAARAITRIGVVNEQYVSALMEALQDDHEGVITCAAEALGLLGPKAVAAIPALVAALPRLHIQSNKMYIRRALAKISGGASGWEDLEAGEPSCALDEEEKVRQLSDKLRDPDRLVRLFAAAILGAYGARAASAVPALRQALRDPLACVRNAAAQALAQINRDTETPIDGH